MMKFIFSSILAASFFLSSQSLQAEAHSRVVSEYFRLFHDAELYQMPTSQAPSSNFWNLAVRTPNSNGQMNYKLLVSPRSDSEASFLVVDDSAPLESSITGSGQIKNGLLDGEVLLGNRSFTYANGVLRRTRTQMAGETIEKTIKSSQAEAAIQLINLERLPVLEDESAMDSLLENEGAIQLFDTQAERLPFKKIDLRSALLNPEDARQNFLRLKDGKEPLPVETPVASAVSTLNKSQSPTARGDDSDANVDSSQLMSEMATQYLSQAGGGLFGLVTKVESSAESTALGSGYDRSLDRPEIDSMEDSESLDIRGSQARAPTN